MAVDSLTRFGTSTFSSLRIRNYRLYYMGQIISTSGTFMQSVAQAWLVLQLTNSGTELGLVMALQYLPVLFLSPFGGVIADRFPKRRLLYFTQFAFAIQGLVLGVLVGTGLVRLWMVYLLAFLFGLVNMLDNPVRQSFVVEMVGEAHLRNAVTLYSSLVNLARIIGPSIAGVLIATVSLALCFIINGISYAAVIIMLALMRASELHSPPPLPRTRGLISSGFRYVLHTPMLRNVLVMLAIIGTLTFEFQVSLPLIAEYTFHSGASGYAALAAAMGVGAVFGGLLTAGQRQVSTRLLVIGALLFGIAVTVTAFMPSLTLAIGGMVLVGVCSIFFTSLGNSLLQLESAPEMRGRVMAFWSIAFLGSTTIGGPIVGWVAEHTEPHWGLAIGGFAGIAAAVFGFLAFRNTRPLPADQAAKEPVVTEPDHKARSP